MKKLRAALALIVCALLLSVSALADDLTTNGGTTLAMADLPFNTDDEAAPVVYFTRDISPEGLVRAYEALGVELPGRVGVKMSTGESERSNYLKPALIGDLIHRDRKSVV